MLPPVDGWWTSDLKRKCVRTALIPSEVGLPHQYAQAGAARLWQLSTNMVSVLPDGAEPWGSNGESCCSRTPVSWHPLTFRCRSPRHRICKHKPPPFTQLRQLREVITSARLMVAKGIFHIVCSFFARPTRPCLGSSVAECLFGHGPRVTAVRWPLNAASQPNSKLSLYSSRSSLLFLQQLKRSLTYFCGEKKYISVWKREQTILKATKAKNKQRHLAWCFPSDCMA